MEFHDIIQHKLNYWVAIVLIMIGLWAMIGKRNLIKKLVGMTIFQSAIIMFFVSMAVKKDSTIPILEHDLVHPPQHEEVQDAAHSDGVATQETHALEINPDNYANPLPHVLMLTAIVVGVATLGVALAIASRIFEAYGTLEEPEIAEHIRRESEEERKRLNA